MGEGTVVAGRPRNKPAAMQITWAPIAHASPTPFTGSSYGQVREAMRETFGEFPISLKTPHLPILHAMAAAARDGGECYRVWARALDKFGGLELVDVE